MPRSDDELRREIGFALSQTSAELEFSIQQAQDRSASELSKGFQLIDRLNAVRMNVLTEDIERLHDGIRSISFEIEDARHALAAPEAVEPGYGSGTFKCHSDFELCYSRAKSVAEKTLCYALLARCIIKG